MERQTTREKTPGWGAAVQALRRAIWGTSQSSAPLPLQVLWALTRRAFRPLPWLPFLFSFPFTFH